MDNAVSMTRKQWMCFKNMSQRPTILATAPFQLSGSFVLRWAIRNQLSVVLFYISCNLLLLVIISKTAHPQLCMRQKHGDRVWLNVAGITLHPANPIELFLVVLSRERDQLPKSMFIACYVIQTGWVQCYE